MSKASFALSFVLLILPTALPASNVAQLQRGSLCAREEKVVFSCAVGKSAKIVSLCSSKELTAAKGYMQYRFGLPGKIELEYPKERKLAQEAFKYSHYFRYQVDYTSIGFILDGHEYMISDDYNGEEKPVHNAQTLTIKPPNGKDVTLKCRGRAKADYGDLPEAFPGHKDFPTGQDRAR